MNADVFSALEPRAVWGHFATLCAIPRPSKHEAALREHLLAWARARNLASRVDAAGNLILKKPASPGCEDRPGVVLQGHLDMVCQKNTGTDHDFHRDPIRPVLRDGWLVAEDTTLGADNGIGVALALAALDAPDLVHPALEVLLTVDEEAGMGGARALAPGSLAGTHLINLDTEEWGEFYLGCAGGMDVEALRPCARAQAPAGWQTWRLAVSGLQGGHSGIDIHRGRGHAIALLLTALAELGERHGLALIELEGGTARNAIPREASARVALPAEAAAAMPAWLAATRTRWQAELAQSDPGVRLDGAPCPAHGLTPLPPLTPADQAAVLAFLAGAPNGLQTMSADFPGVVETSDNLGVVSLDETRLRAVFMVRSLRDAEAHRLAETLMAQARAAGFEARKVGPYPAWTPDPASPLLALAERVYLARFGAPARRQIIHAGLECGLLAASHPELDMLSFGPDIRGAHAPGERVEIASVGRCWELLCDLLQALATSSPPLPPLQSTSKG
jgi:dipeptidase D